jgi:hypothetical protein
MAMTYALAYYNNAKILVVKSFIVQAAGAFIIKSFIQLLIQNRGKLKCLSLPPESNIYGLGWSLTEEAQVAPSLAHKS